MGTHYVPIVLIESDGRLSVHNVSPYITYLPRKDGGDRSKHLRLNTGIAPGCDWMLAQRE